MARTPRRATGQESGRATQLHSEQLARGSCVSVHTRNQLPSTRFQRKQFSGGRTSTSTGLRALKKPSVPAVLCPKATVSKALLPALRSGFLTTYRPYISKHTTQLFLLLNHNSSQTKTHSKENPKDLLTGNTYKVCNVSSKVHTELVLGESFKLSKMRGKKKSLSIS